MSAGDLAAEERLQPQSLTRVLAALEAQQLISRRPDAADRRRLTPVERDLLLLAIRLFDRLAED